jgi:hypothetical protein
VCWGVSGGEVSSMEKGVQIVHSFSQIVYINNMLTLFSACL